jgi:hypothetical protein
MSANGDDPGRVQDQGRPHRRNGSPSPASVALLDRYRAELRAEIGELLDELRPATGQLTLEGGAPARPALDRRRELWDLAVKLARELERGPEPDPTPERSPATARAPRAPRLSPAARRALGAD